MTSVCHIDVFLFICVSLVWMCVSLNQSKYVSIRTVCTHPTVCLSTISYLPGGSLIFAGSEHAFGRTVHLPRLQLRGKRDSRDKSGDQRSVVAWRPVCLSVRLPICPMVLMSVCLTGCEPPWFTFWFLLLASYDRVVIETQIERNSYSVPV